ncbi:threonyl-tRNA synthetase [Elasticomyces elasticus]|uniref:threonine--tRNA ligase n=1 Tax=Exophiala sideris TaxID=1016849 RepID=A0ABR0JC19_9EURO|nr:threonyl-tRNA synthetase [Elasticomyces elasticus]KAK5031248.1 threonyl-tRNA synthetase [Exophiala sideris]KAK5038968.1 threonyl-tRNA synthetase [Exophiala sideris]KAK5060853.1 threonyl-tRNA synthetase [Exophiala sideris]KAK5183764.1 threonyl-tRNA synthetase [Eurotiomycetes sp. CCFEE 6388]
MSQNGTPNGQGGPESSTPEANTSKRPVSESSKKKIPNRPKEMSTNAAPAANQPPKSLPDFIVQRNELFDQLKKEYDEQLVSREKTPIQIKFIPVPGQETTIDGKSWETTPGQLLKNVPKERAGQIVVAKVDGQVWDLDRPLEKDSKVSYLTFDDSEGRDVFWHSSAHVLGECAEHEYGCRLSHGPPTAMGFFYDMALEPGQAVREADWPSIENRAKKYFKDKQPFERLEVSKDNLRKLFGYSKYKMHYIEKFVPDGESSTVYRNGSLVDLCQGPHIQNTRKIESFKIMKNSSAYFLGDQNNDSLQRIHGVAFPTKQQLKDWEHFLEEAKKRDHQVIGQQQRLFMFSKMSPGSPFLLPHGTRIFNALQQMLREQYWDRGYQEVQSPNMYDVDLWKTSGHWQHYQDDMFRVQVKDDSADPMPLSDQKADGKPIAEIKDKDKGVFALKPMNCPGHCIMFRDEERSYRELPWRVADFGVLHRNEASGALSGLTRVRKFQQDDTHIFCTNEQVQGEIEGLFDFMEHVYGLFGFPFKFKLSTRPEGYMGTLEEWDSAEDRLKQALTNFRGENWEMNEGDGAFYGPKIDITISDALMREYQCATIQLDFQGPQNFKLEYRTGESGEAVAQQSSGRDAKGLAPGMARPVMIHRAIIGSFERFIAILCEHFAGKWPFWLSPRQILVIPVMKSAEDYVREIQAIFHKARMYVDIDVSGNTLQKKIRSGQLAQYNFIFVVGAKEQETRTVNIRNRDDLETQKMGQLIPLQKALERLTELRDQRRLENKIDMSE